ncbi:MAG: HTTM domain-containing protein [Rhizobiaceae bacterium]
MITWTPLRTIFSIDLRTLALFRILLGIYLLLNVLSRAQDLVAHYTDFGVLPRHIQIGLLADGSWSLHMFNGTATAQALLFLLAGLAAIGLTLGWRTGLMTLISWALLLSVQNRNIFILSGEDNLALLLTFWALFLPIGARYSIDFALSRQHGSDPTSNSYWSWATVALLLQGMSMYFFSALLKSDPIWIPDGQAVYYALNLDYMATSFALWFRQFQTLMQGLTYYVWVLELVGPILIFSPIFHRPVRAVLMLLFITMHLGFWLFLEIGLFPFISIVMNLTFMPGWMWDQIEDRLRPRAAPKVTIWYDQDCGFCLKMCHILKVFLLLPGTQLKPAQQDPEIGKILEANNSWVVTLGNERALKWAAFGLLIKASPVFSPVSRLTGWGWVNAIGNAVYEQVARHRSGLSQLTRVLMPWRDGPPGQPMGRIGSLVVIGLFTFVTVQNLSTLPKLGISLPSDFIQTRQALGLYQNWTMFAPYPELDSPRPIIEGELEDGTIVDVYRMTVGAPAARWDTHAAKDYDTGRWRKLLANLEDESYGDGDKALARNYARYLCRTWGRDRSDLAPLSSFSILFEVQRTPPPGQLAETRVNNVWHHDCFDTQ